MTGRAISVMQPELALKIAAGEVVERPASAVKELLDNSIDAGATTITVEVRDAGLKLLRVTDNGAGIQNDQLPLAFMSHATSKISDFADLENLTSLGFRGEALPSIAAVARVEARTRARDSAIGSRYTVEYGEAGEIAPCAVPLGTRVSVSDLFGNVPARRKFVRSLRAESGQIQTLLMHYALAHPEIHFTLSIDDRVSFASPGTGVLADAFASVHSADILKDAVGVDRFEAGIAVRGLISRPQRTKANRTGMNIFVNGRVISNRTLLFVVEEAYSGFLMHGRHPFCALELRLNPDEVDANIHPSKSEVRFAREREVHGALYRAVAGSLLDMRVGASHPETRFEVTSLDSDLPVEQPSLLDSGESPAPSVQDVPLVPNLPLLRVFGQANSTFIIAEGPSGLYMIDQHAAHERILYDLLDAAMTTGEVTVQSLLEPLSLALTPQQMLVLETNELLLAQAGFTIEPFGTDACLVRAVPALVGRSSPADVIYEVLNELEVSPEPAALRERAVAAMACKAAVKAGATLTVEEMRDIVGQLERTLRPATCPHGRPTMIHMSNSQLEREFGRR